MSLVDRTFGAMDSGRSGRIMAIPTGLRKYDDAIDGTCQKTFYLYGGETGVGKTSFAREKHIYVPYEQFRKVNDEAKLDVEFVDFSLEIDPVMNMAGFISRKLFREYQKIVPAKKILANLPDEYYTMVKGMDEELRKFNSKFRIYDSDVSPNMYHDILMDVARDNGKFEKEGRYISECEGYIPHNPNKYIIIVVDTVNLGEPDSGHDTVKSTIDRLSRISVWFRNKCGFTIIFLQQFSADMTDINRLRHGIRGPILRDFEDSRRTVKDADVVAGLYEPVRNMRDDQPEYRGYDVKQLKTWFKTLHLLKNRRGESNKWIPLKFDGAVGMFYQLPPAELMTPEEYVNATRH